MYHQSFGSSLMKLALATLSVALIAAGVVSAADQGKSTAAQKPAATTTPAMTAPATTTSPAPSTAPATSEPMAKKGKKHHHKKAAEQPK
jgi:negative regulator of sigma E activity